MPCDCEIEKFTNIVQLTDPTDQVIIPPNTCTNHSILSSFVRWIALFTTLVDHLAIKQNYVVSCHRQSSNSRISATLISRLKLQHVVTHASEVYFIEYAHASDLVTSCILWDLCFRLFRSLWDLKYVSFNSVSVSSIILAISRPRDFLTSGCKTFCRLSE